jgi:thiol-disulfide isomerase/thioredoxin
MKAPSDTASSPSGRRRRLIAGTAVAALVAGLAGVYGIGGFQRNAGTDAGCQAAVDIAKRIAPLARGEVAALTVAEKPLRVPELAFQGADGRQVGLKDWRGRFVLLNLWATWCVPCRKEMPALERLQTNLGGPDFEVVAINIDTRDPEKPKDFLREANLNRLGYFSDQKAKVFQDLKGIGRALGMPTSVLVDGAGCEIATLAGPAEWDSEDAIKLIKAAVKPVAARL